MTRHTHTPLVETFAFWRYGGDHGALAVGARVTRDAHATLAATTRAQILALLPEARGASSG